MILLSLAFLLCACFDSQNKKSHIEISLPLGLQTSHDGIMLSNQLKLESLSIQILSDNHIIQGSTLSRDSFEKDMISFEMDVPEYFDGEVRIVGRAKNIDSAMSNSEQTHYLIASQNFKSGEAGSTTIVDNLYLLNAVRVKIAIVNRYQPDMNLLPITVRLLPQPDIEDVFLMNKISLNVLEQETRLLENDKPVLILIIPEGKYTIEASSDVSINVISKYKDMIWSFASEKDYVVSIPLIHSEGVNHFDTQLNFDEKNSAIKVSATPMNILQNAVDLKTTVSATISNLAYLGYSLIEEQQYCRLPVSHIVTLDQNSENTEYQTILPIAQTVFKNCRYIAVSVDTHDSDIRGLSLLRNPLAPQNNYDFESSKICITSYNKKKMSLVDVMKGKAHGDLYIYYPETITDHESMNIGEMIIEEKHGFEDDNNDESAEFFAKSVIEFPQKKQSRYIPQAFALQTFPDGEKKYPIRLSCQNSATKNYLPAEENRSSIVYISRNANQQNIELDIQVFSEKKEIHAVEFSPLKTQYELDITLKSPASFSSEYMLMYSVSDRITGPTPVSLEENMNIIYSLSLRVDNLEDGDILAIYIWQKEEPINASLVILPIFVNPGHCNDFSPNIPGQPCGGKCGTAKYQCNNGNTKTECIDPLEQKPDVGASCNGKCGSAVYQCNSDNTDVVCVDPVTSQSKSGDGCGGICGTAVYQCNSAKNDIICVDPMANQSKPGTKCGGMCNSAVYVCNTAKNKTECVDPVAKKPLVGSFCGGKCGTAIYQCDASGKDVVCVDPLDDKPNIGDFCGGKCGTAVYQCNSDNTDIFCVDPLQNTPDLGTKCGGMCDTASYQCSNDNKKMVCVDPLQNASVKPVGTACGGVCGTAQYQCNIFNTNTECVDPLAGYTPVGTPCGGICNTATYQCNTQKTMTTCVDPLVNEKALGTPCGGKCGTAIYQCSEDNTEVVCLDPLKHAALPNTPCGGKCGTAQYQCNSDNTDIVCIDPLASYPNVGSACYLGICKTATYQCTSDKQNIYCADPFENIIFNGLLCGGKCKTAQYQCSENGDALECIDPLENISVNCVDNDLDGYFSIDSNGNDCDDSDPNIHPVQYDYYSGECIKDISGNCINYGDPLDSNCDGIDGVDNDRDGVAKNDPNFPDCNDNEFDVHPNLLNDEVGDYIDFNCDGSDGIDNDADNEPSIDSGGQDCDDNDPNIILGCAL